ncbi:MAG: EamA family transporter [Elusimicrobia bacterium]|nr:EamA family transporter [Elusimicrobiota bacterium]
MKYLYAILAAFFFGISAPLSKILLKEIHPFMLASLCYLGSGMGLSLYVVLRKGEGKKEASLESKDLPYVSGFILAGGVLAPVFLFKGLALTSASSASMLLNFELVFTSFLAFLFFKEHIGVRFAFSALLVVFSSVILSFDADVKAFAMEKGMIFIIIASLMWGVDNNLTAMVSSKNPAVLASIKGFAGGAINLFLAVYAGETVPETEFIILGLALGALSYGASLIFFIYSLRGIGAARTSAVFGIYPFIGAFFSFVILREAFGFQFLIAAAFMAAGVFLILIEKHLHGHYHEKLTHDHSHVHDEHHIHEHGPEISEGMPAHSHQHAHETMEHSHPHLPDIHHKHKH